MFNKEKFNKTYDEICAMRYFIQLGMGYVDAHEEVSELNPLTMVFDEMEKKINIIDEFFTEYEASQNKLEG